MYSFHVSFESIMTPRNLTLVTLSKFLPSILIYASLMVRLLENTIKFVLSTLKDNLFAFNHMSIFSISSVSIWFMYVVSISSINRFVSSAKRRLRNLKAMIG